MLSLSSLKFIYEPYPIGVALNVFDHDLYQQMTEGFPPQHLFEYKEVLGHKYSLSEMNNPREYQDFVNSHEVWRSFHEWIKREEFPYEIFDKLCRHNIELGVQRPAGHSPGQLRRIVDQVRGHRSEPAYRLNTRFEFSMLPADGGCIKPHTDAPQKIVTLVVAMPRQAEWKDAYGGGTEVMKPKDISRNYNFVNNQLEFDEVETVGTFDYCPNQCVVFIKTFNSLHGVRPMQGHGTNLMRKTLTINIEKLPG